MHVQQRGGGELPAFLGAQRGVSEPLHVAERMPHLDDGHVDVAGEQAYHDGVGVEQHRLAGGDEIQLPDHMEPVSYRVVQLLGEDHHGIIRMRLSHIMADEPEIGGRAVALATQAHNPTLARERAEEPKYKKHHHPNCINQMTFHSCSPLPKHQVGVLAGLP